MDGAPTNWIEDRNRFKLPTPPQWVLGKLWDFDHMLVLIPSRKERAYLLARRRQFSVGLGEAAMLDNQHPDTNMLYSHHLLPIAPLVFKHGLIEWTQQGVTDVLDALKRRDTWQFVHRDDGTVRDEDAAWKAVEETEAKQEAATRKSLWSDFHHRGRDAWRSMTARAGARNKRASDYVGAARPTK